MTTLSVREARARYFASNGFSDATYHDPWVHLKVGPVPFAFPNTASRKRAIPLHDLHHVATGYDTSFAGEGEIGAWEVAGGCTDHWAAWVLNGLAFGWGLGLAPRRTYRAFVSGRHSRTLYRAGFSEDLLDLEVGELRHRIGLDAPAPATWGDRLAFAGWAALLAAPAAAAATVALLAFR